MDAIELLCHSTKCWFFCVSLWSGHVWPTDFRRGGYPRGTEPGTAGWRHECGPERTTLLNPAYARTLTLLTMNFEIKNGHCVCWIWRWSMRWHCWLLQEAWGMFLYPGLTFSFAWWEMTSTCPKWFFFPGELRFIKHLGRCMPQSIPSLSIHVSRDAFLVFDWIICLPLLMSWQLLGGSAQKMHLSATCWTALTYLWMWQFGTSL